MLYLKEVYLDLRKPFHSQWPDLAAENLAFNLIVSEFVWMSEAECSFFIPVSPLSFIPATTCESNENRGQIRENNKEEVKKESTLM